MSEYASKTKVSVTDSMNEIQSILSKHGITKFMLDLETNSIYFEIDNKPVRISVPKPDIESFRYTPTRQRRTDQQTQKLYEQDIKARWRLIKDLLKLQLELVRLNVLSLKEVFLANFVLRNGNTLAEEWIPKLSGNTADMLELPDKRNE